MMRHPECVGDATDEVALFAFASALVPAVVGYRDELFLAHADDVRISEGGRTAHHASFLLRRLLAAGATERMRAVPLKSLKYQQLARANMQSLGPSHPRMLANVSDIQTCV